MKHALVILSGGQDSVTCLFWAISQGYTCSALTFDYGQLHSIEIESAKKAAELAKKKWVKVVSNMSLGGYEVYEATGELPDPEWPDLSFEKIMEVAFKDRYITGMDHPVIRRLNGEI